MVRKTVVTSQLVRFMSGSYVALSKDHLLPMSYSFGKLLALPRENKDELQNEKENMSQKADEAQKAIKEILETGHQQFEAQWKKDKVAIDAQKNKPN